MRADTFAGAAYSGSLQAVILWFDEDVVACEEPGVKCYHTAHYRVVALKGEKRS
ncbi:MAG: hypothetical protein HY906_02495 [Deltaproteobacteria bacterium]|nr:hypothetical protein [Deltaproteobacteria bacterium]